MLTSDKIEIKSNEKEFTSLAFGNAKWYSQFVSFLQILTYYCRAVSTHGSRYLPNDLKTYIYTKTCVQMFIATLIIIAPKWKQLRCPLIGERINYVTSIQCNLICRKK